jgi:hypothetical protein
MNQKTRKQITHWLSVIVVGIALGLGLQFVRAWTEPTVDPPNGNVGAPINTGAQTQTKAGNLNVNGGILIGATTTSGNMGPGILNAAQVCIKGECQSTWPSGCAPCGYSSAASMYGGLSGTPCGGSFKITTGSLDSGLWCTNYICINGTWNATGCAYPY